MMKLRYLPALFVLLALCGASSAQAAGQYSTAEQYCMQQSAPCLKQCCPNIQGTWDESQQDCIYPGSETETLEDILNGPCGNCANQMITCLSTYQDAPLPPTLPPYQPSSSSCCGSGAILGLLGAAVFMRRR
jgi:hypothetical protein